MKIKPWDKIIIILLLVISFMPYLFLKVLMPNHYNVTYAKITISGELYKEVPLTGQVKPKEFIIDTGYGINKVLIENEAITITEADCLDAVCIHTGFISEPGESIICLPHRLHIQIIGESLNDSEKDKDIIDVDVH